MVTKEEISTWFESLQDDICRSIELEDGQGKFREDSWDRSGGGGGRSRVLADGDVLEKAGVNFSAVWGEMPDKLLASMKLEKGDFYATGVSIVMHPSHPMIPIIHMNVRYFQMSNGKWWFGGGIDLTPHYVDPKQASWFHQRLKSICDQHHPDYYQEFKQWADDYFYIPHRKETRGVGGIFFDHLGAERGEKTDIWPFVQGVGSAFAPIYLELIKENRQLSYSGKHTDWQRVRRGRYVEFNLVYDRGTRFGLETNGRTESILMSMPPQADWHYNYQPEPFSEESKTLSFLKKGIDWEKGGMD